MAILAQMHVPVHKNRSIEVMGTLYSANNTELFKFRVRAVRGPRAPWLRRQRALTRVVRVIIDSTATTSRAPTPGRTGTAPATASTCSLATATRPPAS